MEIAWRWLALPRPLLVGKVLAQGPAREKLKPAGQDDHGICYLSLQTYLERERVATIKHPGVFIWRRDNQAGFTGSRGEGQDPRVEGTEGQI